jgi:predicted alpha-1,2-mannosidase
MKSLRLLFSLLLVASVIMAQTNYSSLVNPFIGTGGHGHTYPGASMPFGMIQMSPDTRLEGWDGCSGYHYSDSLIYGFSQTHLSGTGIPDYCDILLMPFTGDVKWKNSEYASPFSHWEEKASPGYYEVLLRKHNIKVSAAASYRSGIYQFSYDASATEGKLLIDLQHRDEVLESTLQVVNEYEVKGMRRSKSWAQNQVVYFWIKFDTKITGYYFAEDDKEIKLSVQSMSGKKIKSYLVFDLPGDKRIQASIGISGVSMENAKLNLETEVDKTDFASLKKNAEETWKKELGKIAVSGGSAGQQVAFYTALYHTMLAPNVYTDVNGEYRGTDLKVHKADGFTNYTVFSLWDTHRALHPLHAIINRQRTLDWIKTFLAQYKQGGMMPVWELSGNETFCMIGYHVVPVIVDAYKNGIRDFDTKLALQAMTDYAESNRYGLPAYGQQGFISNEDDHESAAKTVEYAYDDWCIAQFAKWIGDEEVYKKYLNRSLNYRNLFDPQTKHIRGKVQGFWYHPFDAAEVNNFFTEGNSWHYSFTAQQDIDGLKKLQGGNEAFAHKLEELFTSQTKLTGREQADVTGLIGQYAHGNEPSHHMAYLFNYAGKPWRTQELVHKICTEFYPNNPDGLIGNEDCGQMSAWLVLSAMGFYCVTPGSGKYALGTPMFDEVKLKLENGKILTIAAKNTGRDNYYVKDVLLNGNSYSPTYISHSDIEKGGSLVFLMDSKPNKTRGVEEKDIPHSRVNDDQFVAVPYFDMESYKFKNSATIKLQHIDPAAAIYYNMQNADGSEGSFTRYTGPFTIYRTMEVKLYAVKNGIKSPVSFRKFYKIPSDISITVQSEVHPMYTAGGKEALIDGIMGTENWKTGDWQSYYGKDFEAIIDLQKIKPLQFVGVHVLQEVSPWIIYPKEVIVEKSDDGKNWQPLITINNKIGTEAKGPEHQQLGAAVKTSTRYIRVKAINGGKLPVWHESAGSPSHLFIDEVIVR